jgi:hypothetical protein
MTRGVPHSPEPIRIPARGTWAALVKVAEKI